MPGILETVRTFFRTDTVTIEPVSSPRVIFSPVAFGEFMKIDLPPRATLLTPILPEKGVAMLYAPRGLGKSWLGLSIGMAVASGSSFLRWSSPTPKTVLYVDGEMCLADLQARLKMIAAGFGKQPDHFHILAADQTENGINLSKSEDQCAIEAHLDGVSLLILDNLSTLTSTSEGASDAWLPIQNWLLKLRRQGISVLLIHHAGLNGKQRGTSRREDALDTVIALRRPPDYSAQEGCRFEIHIEKCRTVSGDALAPFEASIKVVNDKAGVAAVHWIARDLPTPLLRRAAELYRIGHTVTEVGKALGISRSEAGRHRQTAVAEGLLVKAASQAPEAETALEGEISAN